MLKVRCVVFFPLFGPHVAVKVYVTINLFFFLEAGLQAKKNVETMHIPSETKYISILYIHLHIYNSLFLFFLFFII